MQLISFIRNSQKPSFPQTQQFFRLYTGAKYTNEDKSLRYRKDVFSGTRKIVWLLQKYESKKNPGNPLHLRLHSKLIPTANLGRLLVQGFASVVERKSQECESTKQLRAETGGRWSFLGPLSHTCVMNSSLGLWQGNLKSTTGTDAYSDGIPILAVRVDAVIPRTCVTSSNLSSGREEIWLHAFLGLEGTLARSHSLKGIRPGEESFSCGLHDCGRRGGGGWTVSRLCTITWNLFYN